MSRAPRVMVDAGPPLTRRTQNNSEAINLAAFAIAQLDIEAGAGESLDDGLRVDLESGLGFDLTAVRVHRDSAAGDLAAAIEAEAFSIANHIWFASGRFQPNVIAGRKLLVHELTHVAEAGDSQPVVEIADESDPTTGAEPAAETRAETAADDFGTGARGQVAVIGAARRGIGSATRLAKRLSTQGSSVLAQVEPTQVFVRLLDSLLGRNPADRGGRIKAILDRMESGTKSDVVERFSDRGGSQWSRLADMLRDKAPADGGVDPTDGADGAAGASASADTDMAASRAPAKTTAEGAETQDDRRVTEKKQEKDTHQGKAASGAVEDSVKALGFDPAAELDPDAPADSPALEATQAEPANGESAQLATNGAGAKATPPADGAQSVVSSVGPPGGETGGAADIEEELAEALQPALDAQVPTDDEAQALVSLQAAGDESDAESEGPSAVEPDAQSGDLPASQTGEPPADLSKAETLDSSEPDAGMDAAVASPASVAPGSQPDIETPEPQVDGAAEPTNALPGPVDDDAGPVDESPDPTAAPETDTPAPTAGAEVPAEAVAGDGADSCATPAPAPMQDPPGGGACGGGEGGGGGEADTEEAAADAGPAAETTPAAAISGIGGISATARPAALHSAGGVATTEVTGMQDELAAAPPSVERPSGVPGGRDASIVAAALPAPGAASARDSAGLDKASGGTVPHEKALPPIAASVTEQVGSPRLAGDTKITKDDVAKVQKAVGDLPTSDPALSVSAGPAPTLVLDGEADPSRVTTQATGVITTTTDLQREANGHIVEDFGDRDIYPVVPKETLTAKIDVSQIAIAPKTATADGGKASPVVIDRLAEEESGPSDRAAIATEASGMTTGRTKHDEDSITSRDEAKTDLDEAIKANAAEQRGERQSAANEADRSRQGWVDDTATTSKDTRNASTKATDAAGTSITKAETDAKTRAGDAVTDGNTKVKTARTNAEREAEEKKAEAKKESSGGGFFSLLGSAVTSFFNKIKGAIKKAFDAARALVDKAIKAAQKLAVAAIEAGRKFAIAAIEIGGKALKAAGDIALAGFPGARDKWRKTIDKGVAASKKAVNDFADDLKAAAVAILDFLGKALKAYLSALEKLYTMAVEAVEAVVQGAIKFAKAVADTFGAFLAIAADVARDPLGWLKKLGSGAANGAKNCTWPSLKTAVKTWFREKVEALVGVGKAVFDVLLKGCISFAQVAKMAWSAIKASLPVVLVQLLVEKLVAMLIPAGGALSLIIDGLRAAWGAAGRILAAFQAFVAFLQAVRSGQSAPKFGSMIGAAATAVLDFLSNFVLQRIMAAGKKVGSALKATAGKIMAQLKRAAAATKRVAGKALSAAKKAGKSAFGAAKSAGKKAVGAVAAGAKKAGRAIAKTKLGKAVVAGAKSVGSSARKVIDKGKKALAKRQQKKAAKDKKQKKKKETPQQKLDRIAAIIRPEIEGWFDKGVGRLALWAGLGRLQIRHALRSLRVKRTGSTVTIRARVNPEVAVADGFPLSDAELDEVVRLASNDIIHEAWLSDDATHGQKLLAKAQDESMLRTDAATLPDSEKARKELQAQYRKSGAPTKQHRLGNEGIPVQETRGTGSKIASRTNWIVDGLGFYDKETRSGPPSVLKAFKSLGHAGDAGQSDKLAAQRLRAFVQSGVVPSGLEGKKPELAQLSQLLFTRETARTRQNAAHSMMMLDLVEQDPKNSLKSMLADPDRDPGGVAAAAAKGNKAMVASGGRLPVSAKGAMAGTRASFPESNRDDPMKGTQAQKDEMVKRSAALTKQWLKAQGWSFNDPTTSKDMLKELATAHLRKFIKARMSSFYRGGAS